jgi:hypothetical protein
MVLVVSNTFSQKSIKEKQHWYIPDYVNNQYAGNIGFFSVGLGYYILPKYRLYADFVYGYTPSNKSSIDIHDFVLRIGIKPYSIKMTGYIDWRPIFINLAVSKLLNSSSTWENLPNYYPKDYYPQNAFRYHLDIGTSAKYNINNKLGIELYSLSTTNDLYLRYYNHYYRSGHLHLHDIFSAAIGINIIFYDNNHSQIEEQTILNPLKAIKYK